MKTKKLKINTIKAVRLCIQIIVFIFLPSLYYSVFSGIKQLILAVIHQNPGLVQAPALIALIAVVPVTLLLGRFFCGWMCAFGAFLDFIYIVCKKLFKVNFKVNEKADSILKYAKYVWLLVLLILWTLSSSVFAAANPWDVFGMTATVGKAPAISYVVTNLTAGFILFCLIIVGSAFIERFFCRYLCPLGAIFGVVSKLKLTRISKPREKCGKCRICTNSCAMGIPLYKRDKIGSGECINCMKCINACPRGNVSFTVTGGNLRPLVAGTVTAAAMTGIYYLGDLASTAIKFAEPASAGLTTSVASSTSSDTASSKTASGKTSSKSTAISLKTSVTSKSTVSSSASTASTSSTYTASSKAASVSSKATTPAKTTTSSKASTSSKTTTNSSKTTTNKLTYKDGTYQGSGTGFRGGTTTVSVTIKSDKITAINLVSTDDDQQFFDSAFTTVTNEITGTQSAEVDAVSGATFSSNGIMEAVSNALSNAKA